MADWKDSIVLLTRPDGSNQSFGTGFVFHRDQAGWSYVLTCLHVVEDLTKAPKGGSEEACVLINGEVAEVYARGDEVLDLAVLRVEGLSLTPLALGRPIDRDRSVEILGYTDHESKHQSAALRPLTGTVRDNNLVRSVLRPRQPSAWSLDVEIDKEMFRTLTEGYSGSPVVDPATDRVVGVMNLKWSGEKGHALCVRSCDLINPPIAQIPGFSSAPEHQPPVSTALRSSSARSLAAGEGAFAWLASTLDHDDVLGRITRRLEECNGVGARFDPLILVVQACLSDCPRTLVEHLAADLGLLGMDAPWANELITELHPRRFDRQGFWRALLDSTAPTGTEGQVGAVDIVLSWLDRAPRSSRGPVRVVYCPLDIAEQKDRIPVFVSGAVEAFRDLHGARANTRVIVVFACIFEETRLGGWLQRKRVSGLSKLAGCEPLGELKKLKRWDLAAWLHRIEDSTRPDHRPDAQTRRRLQEVLEPLLPDDSTRIRYRHLRRPALAVLTQADCPNHAPRLPDQGDQK